MALPTGARRALQAIAAGRFHNASPSTLRALAADGLLSDPDGKPQLTPAGAQRVARMAKCAGSMHRRTWHVGVSKELEASDASV